MNSRRPPPCPAPALAGRLPPPLPPLPPLPERSPMARRLAVALDSRLRRRRGRLDRLELSLVHTVPAGAGGTTDWYLRARVEDLRTASDGRARAPLPGLRAVDRGALPSGQGLAELWQWVLDTSTLHRLAAPALDEAVRFADAAASASTEVIRQRVLRSAAVLERLPVALEVKFARRRAPAVPAGEALSPVEAESTPHAGVRPPPAAGPVPVVRLIARFPSRDGSAADTQVVVWDAAREPDLVELLRDCARRLAPPMPG
jgi:hypothetical protein